MTLSKVMTNDKSSTEIILKYQEESLSQISCKIIHWKFMLDDLKFRKKQKELFIKIIFLTNKKI